MEIILFLKIKNCYPQANSGLVEKVPSGHLEQDDFPYWQVAFHSHLPNEQGVGKVVCHLKHQKSKLRLAQAKQNLRATCLKGKLGFIFLALSNISHNILQFSLEII